MPAGDGDQRRFDDELADDVGCWRAPIARRRPISGVRSSTLASMMFMMPMPPTSSEIDASATITMSKIRLVRCCSASSSRRHDERVVARAAVGGVEDAAHDAGRRARCPTPALQPQVDAVDLVANWL